MIVIYVVTFILMIIIMRMLISYAFLCEKRKYLKLIENNKNFKIFIYFLLTNEIYKDFRKHLYNEHRIINIDVWIKTINESYLISEAFRWNDTKQGYDFWYEMNLLWNQHYKNKNIELLLVKNLIEERL